MSQDQQLADLEQQHRVLEKKLVEAMKRRSTDDLTIVALKREKLHLKDQMVRLQEGSLH